MEKTPRFDPTDSRFLVAALNFVRVELESGRTDKALQAVKVLVHLVTAHGNAVGAFSKPKVETRREKKIRLARFIAEARFAITVLRVLDAKGRAKANTPAAIRAAMRGKKLSKDTIRRTLQRLILPRP